jgi:hypothetical protein
MEQNAAVISPARVAPSLRYVRLQLKYERFACGRARDWPM